MKSWHEVLGIEIQKTYALETAFAMALERLEAKAYDQRTRERLRDLASVSTVHADRLERLAFLGRFELAGDSSKILDGWWQDVEELVMREGSSLSLDALILALVQKIVQTKQGCYQMAGILARGLNESQIVEPLYETQQEDDTASNEVSRLVTALVAEAHSEWLDGIWLR